MFSVNELLKATPGKLVNSLNSTNLSGISIDSRTINPGNAFIAIKGYNFDGHDFIDEAIRKGATCIIKERRPKRISQKVNTLLNTEGQAKRVAFIEVQDTIKALGDIARFWRKKFNIPVIAITGSNGKTTTKEMLAWILSKRFKVLKNEGTKNNQIGLPLTLLNLNSSYDITVLEIGTNHFGEVDYLSRICQPNIGVITNIGPAHLENFHSPEGVLREKYKLIENLKNPYIGILNADDEFLSRKIISKKEKMIIFSFGIKSHCDFFATDVKLNSNKLEFSVNNKSIMKAFSLETIGYYNIYNALAGIAVARILGIDYNDIALRLATFDFPQSRLKFIKLNNINFIDDTYNSNPLSLKQALDALDNFRTKGRKIFVMGDMLELGTYEKTFHYQAGLQAARHCDIFITVGKLSKLAADAAGNRGFNNRNIFTCKTTKEARNILFDKLSPKKDDLILVKGSRLMKMEEIFRQT